MAATLLGLIPTHLVSAQTVDVAVTPSSPAPASATKTPKKTNPATLALQRRLARKGYRLGAGAFIRIYKETSELELWLANEATSGVSGKPRFRLYKIFPICKWSGKIGPKLMEGDLQSPEGVYAIERWQLRPRTKNHRAIEVGFPNVYDRANGRTGSHIQIHGGCSSVGCFAMTNPGIEEIYDIVEAALSGGQERVPLHIFPFRLTPEALAERKDDPWAAFWRSLQPIQDHFGVASSVPDVKVCAKYYAVSPGLMSGARACLVPWHGAKKQYFAGTGGGKNTGDPRIKVRCNLKLASCKRWLALAKRRLAGGGQVAPISRRARLQRSIRR